MGYAKHIGRVGALAVTLGVGLAIGSAPVAYADDSVTSATADSSSSPKNASSKDSAVKDSAAKDSAVKDSAVKDAATKESATKDSASKDSSSKDSGSKDSPGTKTKRRAKRSSTDTTTSESRRSAAKDTDKPTDAAPKDSSAVDALSKDDAKSVTPSVIAPRSSIVSRPKGKVESAAGKQSLTSATDSAITKVAATEAVTKSTALQTVSQPRPLVADVVRAVLQPLSGTGDGSPLQLPVLTAVLAAVRNELERNMARPGTTVVAQQTVSKMVKPDDRVSAAAVDTTPHVLVIGVDGTNLEKILADPENDNFFELMDQSTTAASTIVGHTTVSNPSWTTILTGVWGETAGVSNNVFVPGVYDRYPTVFNQLESQNPNIATTVIANWEGTAAIGQAGQNPADTVYFVPQIAGDTNWLATDDRVGELSVDAIRNTVAGTPSMQFTYFVGVDENGHMYGADSAEYKAAIANVDENLGAILDEVALREAAGEDWTIIVVTDHGIVGPHQPLDRGHGFQSPEETTTFVIADIAGDTCDGCMNNAYKIVDITPTVVSLFGVGQQTYFEGVPLANRSASTTTPVDLHQALNTAIDMYGYPDIVTNVALTVRTVATIVPYYIYDLKHSTLEQLQGNPLGDVATVPVSLFFDALYVATNVPAQIVARVTGVTGASIFPLLPPAWPTFPPVPDQTSTPDMFVASCGDGRTVIACRAV